MSCTIYGAMAIALIVVLFVALALAGYFGDEGP